jgi:hypothetical protein
MAEENTLGGFRELPHFSHQPASAARPDASLHPVAATAGLKETLKLAVLFKNTVGMWGKHDSPGEPGSTHAILSSVEAKSL